MLTIIVNDGSTDDTADFIKADRIITHAKNEGLRDSFNKAAELVETPYFLRVDDDITFPNGTDWPDKVAAHFDAHPECGVIGATQYLHDGRLWCVGDKLLPRYQHIKNKINGSYRICQSVMGCFSAFRKSIWPGLTCSKWMRAETEDVNIRIQKAGHEVHCLPIEFIHWHGFGAIKTGTYNDGQKGKRIREHMQANYHYDFYNDSRGCLPWLKEIRDV